MYKKPLWAALKLELKKKPKQCYAEQTHDWRHNAAETRTAKKEEEKQTMRVLGSPTDQHMNSLRICLSAKRYSKSAIPALPEILFLLNTY